MIDWELFDNYLKSILNLNDADLKNLYNSPLEGEGISMSSQYTEKCSASEVLTSKYNVFGNQCLLGDGKNVWRTKFGSSLGDYLNISNYMGSPYNKKAIHCPFFTSFLSEKDRVVHQTIEHTAFMITNVPCDYYVTHLGKTTHLTEDEVLEKLSEGLIRVYDRANEESPHMKPAKVLLENPVKKGPTGNLDFLAKVCDKVNTALAGEAVGICMDTAHAFGYGYNLADKEVCTIVGSKFEKYLDIIHLNDSNIEKVKKCGSHRDRHETLGAGLIGDMTCFSALLESAKPDLYITERSTSLASLFDIMLYRYFKMTGECLIKTPLFEDLKVL